MKKIYDRVVKIQIGHYGQGWECASMWGHYEVKEEAEVVNTEDWYSQFDALDERILKDNIYNATVEDTKRGRKISLSTTCRDFRYNIFSNKSEIMREAIGIKVEYIEVKNPTFDFLTKNISADDMFEYLRDRDITLKSFL